MCACGWTRLYRYATTHAPATLAQGWRVGVLVAGIWGLWRRLRSGQGRSGAYAAGAAWQWTVGKVGEGQLQRIVSDERRVREVGKVWPGAVPRTVGSSVG